MKPSTGLQRKMAFYRSSFESDGSDVKRVERAIGRSMKKLKSPGFYSYGYDHLKMGYLDTLFHLFNFYQQISSPGIL